MSKDIHGPGYKCDHLKNSPWVKLADPYQPTVTGEHTFLLTMRALGNRRTAILALAQQVKTLGPKASTSFDGVDRWLYSNAGELLHEALAAGLTPQDIASATSAVDAWGKFPQAATPQAATPQAATPQAATPQAATPQAATPQAATPQAATPQAKAPKKRR